MSTVLPVRLPSGRLIDVVVERRAGRRRITLRVDPLRGAATVSGPPRVRLDEIARFAAQQGAWIEARLAAAPPAAPFAEGASVPIRGRPTRLVRRDGRGAARLIDGAEPVLETPAAPDRFAARVAATLKTMAHDDALAALSALRPRLAKAPAGIRVRDARTRWGSCSSTGDLMLNWRLIGAPPAVLSYVVAHECAHLIHMNHSPAFWAEVARLDPNWKPARAWLKANGASLQALGRTTDAPVTEDRDGPSL